MNSRFAVRRFVLLGLVAAILACQMPPAGAAQAGLDEAFAEPPDTVKPWCYWWWLKGNIDRPLITQNLEAMKRVGFGGLLHFDAREYHEDLVPMPPSRLDFMSPQWREMLKFSLNEAHRLGLEVSVNLSSCAGALKGPWVVGDDAPKQLLWNATECRGPALLKSELPAPAGRRFWNLALLAVRSDDMPATPPGAWQVVAPPLGDKPSATEVVDLTSKIDAHGAVAWEVPAGRWVVIRFGSATMQGHEYDVDILDAKAVTGHFDRMGRTILRDAGPLVGKTLTHFYSVSWEGAAPTSTVHLEPQFAKYRGYELRPWLPVLAGVNLKDRATSQRFLRDYYRTLADLFRDNFYATMQNLCHQAGLQWHSESGGPWDRKIASFAEADQFEFLARNDMPQGEFWYTGTPVGPSPQPGGAPIYKRRQDLNRPQAMTAHIYGRKLAAAEAFTHMVGHWSAYPAALKPFADTSSCEGVNQFIWHTFTASPPEFGKPGSEYFAGTHINSNVTWFPQAGPLMTYLARCQLMLRQGLFVGDVCTYIGERPYLHWNRGASWSANTSLALPKGYAYDLVNSEVLLTRMAVNDGDLVLPDGMRYRMLVVDLDDDVVTPEVLAKIKSLAQAGATVVLGGRQPQSARGLGDYPAGDGKVRQMAAELWAAPGSRALGRGQLIQGAGLGEVLASKGILPDYEGPWEFTHRRTADAEVYYISGQGTAQCTFRVRGREPELWDPVSGRCRDAVAWRETADGRTIVPLTLPENGSVFIVFRRPAQKQHLLAAPAEGIEIIGRGPQGAQVRQWNAELTLKGPWNLEFEVGRGAPASAIFEQLIAWNQHSDPGIKHFSGAAVYRNRFDLTPEQSRSLLKLDLGDVKHVAEVGLNGKPLGIVWTAPWAIDMTGAARAGGNDLEITVVNTWVNRLIGDAALPREQQITKSCLPLVKGKRPFPVYKGYASEDPLTPSGLIGPVRLMFGQPGTIVWQ